MNAGRRSLGFTSSGTQTTPDKRKPSEVNVRLSSGTILLRTYGMNHKDKNLPVSDPLPLSRPSPFARGTLHSPPCKGGRPRQRQGVAHRQIFVSGSSSRHYTAYSTIPTPVAHGFTAS